jgi:Dyp-type peroxidase family
MIETEPSVSKSWKLEPSIAKQTQGLIVSAFGDLPLADALFLELGPQAGGAWLTELRQEIPISDATGKGCSAAAIALTWSGLQRMGLDAEALESFSPPFREGMHQLDRQRRLGDNPGGPTVIPGGARWSGNNLRDGGTQAPAGTTTPCTVHVVLLLYAKGETELDDQARRLTPRLEQGGVHVVHRLRLSLMPDAKRVAREHFGFADGLSQPMLYGPTIISPQDPGAEARRRWHGIPAGEVLLGHLNAHKEAAPGPVVAATSPQARQHLSAHGVSEGFRNLGLHGSYLVIRELRQDVAAFWNSMGEAAKSVGDGASAQWVAERVVGRTQDGALLRPDGATQPAAGADGNDVGFAEEDVQGFGCPLGAHIRRGNPRDSLPSRDGPNPDLKPTKDLLSSTNSHRLLRRGRKFGDEIKDRYVDDRATRGLLFMALNSDIARHFEFVQQTWMLNQAFGTLEEETDPLMGPKGLFSIPAAPLRRCVAVETFIRFAGGEYFFLPSLPALDYLAALPPAALPPAGAP